jgi:hypothetical protein
MNRPHTTKASTQSNQFKMTFPISDNNESKRQLDRFITNIPTGV